MYEEPIGPVQPFLSAYNKAASEIDVRHDLSAAEKVSKGKTLCCDVCI
jgi:hypothetical protein